MPVCDTTWLLAFVDPHDPRHDQAKAAAESASILSIPRPALQELLQIVMHRRRRMDGQEGAQLAARKTLAALEALPMIKIVDGPDPNELYRTQPNISYADAAVIVAANEDPEGLLTLDPFQEALLA